MYSFLPSPEVLSGTVFTTNFNEKQLANPFEKYLTKEDVLQRSVVDYLKLQYPKAFFCHTPNEGKRTKFEQFKAKTLGIVAGMPDLMIYEPMIYMPEGESKGIFKVGLAIELKIKPNKATQNQIEVLNKLRDRNWVTVICYTFEEAKSYIDWHFTPITNPYLTEKTFYHIYKPEQGFSPKTNF